MHQVGKRWIELGVLALLGVLATPLACGGVAENGGASSAGASSGGAGAAGFAGGAVADPCAPCFGQAPGICPDYCRGDGVSPPYMGAPIGGSGNIVGVDDGSDIVGIGGFSGYDDGAFIEIEGGYGGTPGSAGHGGHAGNSGASAVGGGPHFDGGAF